MGFEYLIALGIITNLMSVNLTINFNDQASGMAVEIDNKTVNDLLAAKVNPINPVSTQPFPKPFFRLGHLFSQPPRLCHFLGHNTLPNHDVSLRFFYGTYPPRPPLFASLIVGYACACEERGSTWLFEGLFSWLF